MRHETPQLSVNERSLNPRERGLDPCFTLSGPQSSSSGDTWELVRNADPPSPRPRICTVMDYQDIPTYSDFLLFIFQNIYWSTVDLTLYLFQVYKVVIQHLYKSWNAHHSSCTYQLSPYKVSTGQPFSSYEKQPRPSRMAVPARPPRVIMADSRGVAWASVFWNQQLFLSCNNTTYVKGQKAFLPLCIGEPAMTSFQ